MSRPIIVRSDDPRAADLAARGWVVAARSWAAELSLMDEGGLQTIVARPSDEGVIVREIVGADLARVLALDQDTRADYPGGPATAHRPLTPATATVIDARRAFGAFLPEGALVAMTFLDVDAEHLQHRLHGLIQVSLDILATPEAQVDAAFAWLKTEPMPEDAWIRRPGDTEAEPVD